MAFCRSCGNQLAKDERFCTKCGADQGAKTGAPGAEPTTAAEAAAVAPATPPAVTPPQYFPPAGMVPVATTPPATGMQNQNKIWAVVIGAAVLFAIYHFSGHSFEPGQQSGPINLIFVVSEDLAYQSSGDLNPYTANLTSQGLQRSLLRGTFLHQLVGATQVNGIYVLTPMTHLQTASNYPDMVSAETVQQF